MADLISERTLKVIDRSVDFSGRNEDAADHHDEANGWHLDDPPTDRGILRRFPAAARPRVRRAAAVATAVAIVAISAALVYAVVHSGRERVTLRADVAAMNEQTRQSIERWIANENPSIVAVETDRSPSQRGRVRLARSGRPPNPVSRRKIARR